MPDITEAIIRRISDLEKKVVNVAIEKPQFTIQNVNVVTLTGNVNDYDPGNCDVLEVLTSGNYNMTGISGGLNGRLLRILKYGANNLSIMHNNASSQAQNRIICPAGADLTLTTVGSVTLHYSTGSGSSFWYVVGYVL